METRLPRVLKLVLEIAYRHAMKFIVFMYVSFFFSLCLTFHILSCSHGLIEYNVFIDLHAMVVLRRSLRHKYFRNLSFISNMLFILLFLFSCFHNIHRFTENKIN